MFNYKIKYILVIILYIFLISCSNETQNIEKVSEKVPERVLKNDKEYISLSYFHIFKKNISNILLEKCVSVISTTSDKELVKDLIIRSWVFQTPIQNNNILDEDYYRVIYNASPVITSKFNINEILKLINFYFYNEMYNSSNFQDFNKIAQISIDINKLCPIIIGAFDSEDDCLKADVKLLHQSIKNPQELEILITYFKTNINKYKRLFSTESNEDAYFQLKSMLYSKYPMMQYYISEDSIDKCLEAAKTSNSIPNLDKLRKDIPTFIFQTYDFLLSREPTDIEMSEWTTYYSNQQTEAVPGLILYIIMTSDEYKYF